MKIAINRIIPQIIEIENPNRSSTLVICVRRLIFKFIQLTLSLCDWITLSLCRNLFSETHLSITIHFLDVKDRFLENIKM